MNKLLKSVLTKALNKSSLISIIHLIFSKGGYLISTGWLKSSFAQKALSYRGEQIPWLTYPAVKFLESKLKSDMHVFEYGAGASTIWFSSKVNKVVSVENDTQWFNHIKGILPNNVECIYSQSPPDKSYKDLAFLPIGEGLEYSKVIHQFDILFDVILIDGIDRQNCIIESLSKLTQNGILIIDNFEHIHLMHQSILRIEKDKFKSISFWGLSPGIAYETCTAIFYREENCFNI